MKANEFVKKHGWEAVDNAVKNTNAEETAFFESTNLDPILSKNGDTIGFDVKVYRIKYDEVKRLVESHELVESKGGLVKCKEILDQDGFTWCSGGNYYASPLEQAIADVESCGGGHESN